MIKHLACIMDGNRRWARKQRKLFGDGHRQGIRAAERVMDFCLQQSIPYLSLYTFSLENFRRSATERYFLFNILFKEIREKMVDVFRKKKIRISFRGDQTLFPESVRDDCAEIEAETAQGDALHVSLLFCYGGRQEIVAGVKKVVATIQRGDLSVDQLTDTMFETYLWTAGFPAPDMIIRTGGVHRLSNFLLFQAAYSELFFLDCLWPELDDTHLKTVITSFQERQRNFGI